MVAVVDGTDELIEVAAELEGLLETALELDLMVVEVEALMVVVVLLVLVDQLFDVLFKVDLVVVDVVCVDVCGSLLLRTAI